MTRRPPVSPRLATWLPVVGVFTMIAVAVGGAFTGRATRADSSLPGASVTAERDLQFFDRDDGAVLVQTPRDHRTVAVFQGEQGFLRGTLRGFARTRHLDGLGQEAPFRLARWSDGRLTLDDPATSQHVELMAFGSTNAAVFAPLLDAQP